MIREPEALPLAPSGAVLEHISPSSRSEADQEAYLEVPDLPESHGLSALITRTASKQAYYTVRLLVDRDRRLAAYRAYAYFRWVDDRLDQPVSGRAERIDFIARQQELVACARRGPRWSRWSDLTREERLVMDLIRNDDQPASGLQSYISHMMAVMAFDAHRRGRWVTEHELDQYTEHLAIAVTDALHYFIGHADTPPPSEARYFPAMAAHMTHMLRDTFEDVALGYFNVPSEVLEASGIDPRDVHAAPYRAWVKGRVQVTRGYFEEGARYLDQVQSLRCRLAGYAYMARFAGVLDAIEREEYRLRPAYPEFSHPGYALRVGSAVVLHTLLRRQRGTRGKR
jgi:phytoene/squalene synthetase